MQLTGLSWRIDFDSEEGVGWLNHLVVVGGYSGGDKADDVFPTIGNSQNSGALHVVGCSRREIGDGQSDYVI